MRVQRISVTGIIALLVSLPLICNSLVFAKGWSVESLQREIDARGYKWRAGKTSLSDLSLEEFIKLSSADPCYPSYYMMPAEDRITLPDDFPTYLDWRNYKGGNWISPVKNQGLLCGRMFGDRFALVEILYAIHFFSSRGCGSRAVIYIHA